MTVVAGFLGPVGGIIYMLAMPDESSLATPPNQIKAMRKTTAYARKARRTGSTFNGAEYMNTIQRCRAYTDEPVPGSLVEGTQDVATKAMILVQDAYGLIKTGKAPDYRAFDIIAHALGISMLRAIEIAGEDDYTNTMLPILKSATNAMERVRARYDRIKMWGFDGPAIDEVLAGIEIYETILQASSPAQMAGAAEKREEILRARKS